MNIHLGEISATLYLFQKQGLWFIDLDIYYFQKHVGSIRRGGYVKRSSAIAQGTRLFNNRMYTASLFI